VVVLEGSLAFVVSGFEVASCLSNVCLTAVWARESVDSRACEWVWVAGSGLGGVVGCCLCGRL
jgi:hypothetical protein